MLKKFIIKKLYGTTDVELVLKPGVNIYVGENGIGKTTILNLLHSFITIDLKKMSEVKYDKVILELSSKKFVFTNEGIGKVLSSLVNEERFYDRKRILSNKSQIDSVIKIIEKLTNDELMNFSSSPRKYRDFIIKIREEHLSDDEPTGYAIDVVHSLIMSDAYKTVKQLIELKESLVYETLYFPTFRRIETDLKTLGLSDEDYAQKLTRNTLLNFGMGDVTKLLDGKLTAIEKSIKSGFGKMTTTLLNQYVNNDKLKKEEIDIKNLDTIFSILSDSLPKDLKEKIYNLVNDKKIYESSNEILLNYINCLVDIYNSQSENINNVEKFVETCNKYLYNKKIEFIKNELKVTVKSNDDGREIEFSNLSSGEKQMISIFSKLFLENDRRFLILFDEPELSLSIEWQRMLIPDIMKTESCQQLLATTHSPFIFDNIYDKNVRSLQDCLKR